MLSQLKKNDEKEEHVRKFITLIIVINNILNIVLS